MDDSNRLAVLVAMVETRLHHLTVDDSDRLAVLVVLPHHPIRSNRLVDPFEPTGIVSWMGISYDMGSF